MTKSPQTLGAGPGLELRTPSLAARCTYLRKVDRPCYVSRAAIIFLPDTEYPHSVPISQAHYKRSERKSIA